MKLQTRTARTSPILEKRGGSGGKVASGRGIFTFLCHRNLLVYDYDRTVCTKPIICAGFITYSTENVAFESTTDYLIMQHTSLHQPLLRIHTDI